MSLALPQIPDPMAQPFMPQTGIDMLLGQMNPTFELIPEQESNEQEPESDEQESEFDEQEPNANDPNEQEPVANDPEVNDPPVIDPIYNVHIIRSPLTPDSGLNTPEFSPISVEDFDVARDISNWESFNENINDIENINFENYI
jgi:hypothetical protein